ncbi:hypothetical protein PYW08_003960 [Mythimna loreyi]|uniref:Uncharacterized protein n=1 Tax=Mythimna loreyi TaxID=667449 RepID=A0ACC2QUE3_9NEOP|nr:hypothetical protein PYW08_003960 [Mythimna loreyi]
MHVKSATTIVAALVATCVSGYPNLWHNNQLTPVHGLYVKPSSDGTTGDLFVAATEENGVKSQWAADKPVNFLTVAATAQPQAAAMPAAYPSLYSTQHDESATHKRSVMPSAVPNAPVQYAYAMPVQSGTQAEGGQVATYPYAYAIPSTTSTATETPKCEHQAAASPYPYQLPFQMFYPQMMSAYTNAMSILKDAGMSEESASTVMSQAAPTWSPTYAYPMYVMVDPNTWNKNQATTTTTPPPTSNTQSEENTQA